MARSRSSGGRSSPAPSRSSSSSSSSSSNTATRGNPTQHNKPVAHPPAAASSSAAAHHAAPAAGHPQQHAAPPAQGGGMMAGLASTMMSGMAFGTGSAVAHRAIDGIMGPREVQHTHNNAPAAGEAASSRNPCEQQNTRFMACMKDNSGSIASCQNFFDSLSQCQREQPQMN